MATHEVATLHFLRLVLSTPVSQKWDADDGSTVELYVSYIGYNVNASKCQLEEKNLQRSTVSGIRVEGVDGCRVLRSVIGNYKAYDSFNIW